MDNLFEWYLNQSPPDASSFCKTRDVAKARIEKFKSRLDKSKLSVADSALITALLGELANNAFDHNLGQWHGETGCFLALTEQPSKPLLIGVADRGQGIRSSLKYVVKEKLTDQVALNIAFNQVLSGRKPEKRGNGLKFVKSIILNNKNASILALTKKGKVIIGDPKIIPKNIAAKADAVLKKDISGTLFVICWS
jgi:hypothetical protein